VQQVIVSSQFDHPAAVHDGAAVHHGHGIANSGRKLEVLFD
jgi:hypothetical protein